MPKFLIDENLPHKFSLWDDEEFVHQYELDRIKSDEEIWEYAKNNELTIITKDADFSDRIIFAKPPQKSSTSELVICVLKTCFNSLKKIGRKFKIIQKTIN